MNVETNIDTTLKTPDLAERIVSIIPKLVKPLTPSDGAEQKAAFLTGSTNCPDHTYDSHLSDEFLSARLNDIDMLLVSVRTDESLGLHHFAYEGVADEARQKFLLLKSARDIKDSNGEDLDAIEAYRSANIEIFGEPNADIYSSILTKVTQEIEKISESPDEIRKSIANQLMTLLPERARRTNEGLFTPSDETIEWTGRVVKNLYGGLLAHVRQGKESYDGKAIAELFSEIITEEFEDAAIGWRVELRSDTSSIEVDRIGRVVNVPSSKKDVPAEKVRGLVVHELGVHFMRSVIGEESDLSLLRVGLSNYVDAEEGLGVVLEQSLSGTYKPSGEDLFLAASLAHYDGMDFRQVHEILWRKEALESSRPIDDDELERIKAAKYGVTQRIFRGTDKCALLKDISYMQGSQKIWRHLESIRGDDTLLTLLFMGKSDPTSSEHRRAVLNARSR